MLNRERIRELALLIKADAENPTPSELLPEWADELARLALEEVPAVVHVGMVLENGAPIFVAARPTHDAAITWAKNKARCQATHPRPTPFAMPVKLP